MKAPIPLIAFLVDVYIYSEVKRKIIKRVLCDGMKPCELEDEFGYSSRQIERYVKEGRDMLAERMSV
jgi:hypothetical protein